MRLLASTLLFALALAGCQGEGCPPGTLRKDAVCVKAPDPAPETTPPAGDEDVTEDEEEAVEASSLPPCVQYVVLGQACSCPCTFASCVDEFRFTDGPCCRCMGNRGVVCARPVHVGPPLQCPTSN